MRSHKYVRPPNHGGQLRPKHNEFPSINLAMIVAIVCCIVIILIFAFICKKKDPPTGQENQAVEVVCTSVFDHIRRVNLYLEKSNNAPVTKSKDTYVSVSSSDTVSLNTWNALRDSLCSTYWAPGGTDRPWRENAKEVCPNLLDSRIRVWSETYLSYGFPSRKYAIKHSTAGMEVLHQMRESEDKTLVEDMTRHCASAVDKSYPGGSDAVKSILQQSCLLVETVMCEWHRVTLPKFPEPECDSCGLVVLPTTENILQALALLRERLLPYFCRPRDWETYRKKLKEIELKAEKMKAKNVTQSEDIFSHEINLLSQTEDKIIVDACDNEVDDEELKTKLNSAKKMYTQPQ